MQKSFQLGQNKAVYIENPPARTHGITDHGEEEKEAEDELWLPFGHNLI